MRSDLLTGTPHENLRKAFADALFAIEGASFDFTAIEKESRLRPEDKIETEFEGNSPNGRIEVTLSMDSMFGEGYIAIVLDGKVVDQKRAKKAENFGRMIAAGIRKVNDLAR